MHYCNTYESKIFIGGREGYNGNFFSKEQVINLISKYQSENPECEVGAVSIFDTTYLFQNYCEHGYMIYSINYPRFTRTDKEIDKFSVGLARFLKDELKQNRVSIVFPDKTIMLGEKE